MEDLRGVVAEDSRRLDAIKAEVGGSPLYNEDLAPTDYGRRTWGTYNFVALWIGMAVVITTYTLAAGLMAVGMNWWQALFTIGLGNLIVLVPMLLNGHAGTKYGIPFPVFVRSSFGVFGANFAAIARALVACGWFGIQTWIGGLALNSLLGAVWGGWADIAAGQAISFMVFWAIQVVIIMFGMEGVKFLESFAAPILLAGGLVLLGWGFIAGGGVGAVFSTSAQLQGEGGAPFWALFWPGLAANVGYWATLSLNIPDFTRYSRNQRSQVVGQAATLPTAMIAFSFIGIAVTAATVVVLPEPVWQPVDLIVQIAGGFPVVLILAMIVIMIAQISTNMAANVVSPSNDFSNLAPKYISFRMGGLITALLGIVSFPWVLFNSAGAYIFTWLIGYGSLLGAIGAVMIVDYWIVRRTRLDLADLYKTDGQYAYSGGWNWKAIIAVFVGVIPVVPGFLSAATTPGFAGFEDPNLLQSLYTYGIFFTFVVAAVAYLLLTLIPSRQSEPSGEPRVI